MISVVDYGLGNVEAFLNIYKRHNVKARRVASPTELLRSDCLILPGVGAFDFAMQKLNASGMRESLDIAVLENKIPVLGVCVGMQMMANKSDEGSEPGLGWIPGNVRYLGKLPSKVTKLLLPHMGWNKVIASSDNPLVPKDRDLWFYFLHSYYFAPERECDEFCFTQYGSKFSSAVVKNNIFGVQFHPEKSHQDGVDLLMKFAGLAEC